MPENVFTPTSQAKPIKQVTANTAPIASQSSPDQLSAGLLRGARLTVVWFTFLLPIFFLPGLWGSLGFQKVLLALGAVVLVLITLSLLMLRTSQVRTVLPIPLWCFFGFIGVATASAIFSDSPAVAFRGSVLETGTVAFFVLIAGVMLLPLVLQQSKKYMLWSLQALVVSSLMVLVYSVTRLFFGPVLAFESFGLVTAGPVGVFNDLAVFAGLSILVSLIALLQLPLRISLQALLLVVVSLSLIVLAVVNFSLLWFVTGFFSLLLLLFVVSRDHLFALESEQATPPAPHNYMLFATTVLVGVVSAWFIVLDNVATEQINRWLDVPYLEIRPSFLLTVDIAQAIYQDDLLLGTGPNQFVNAWRQHKNPAINDDIYWATDFTAGSSYGTTIAVTTGVLGFALFILFQAWYGWFGFKMLVLSHRPDPFWYFAGAASFAGAAFLWLTTYLYVPGVTILLLAALLTGLSFVAGSILLPKTVRLIPLVCNRRRGFGLMALAILLISGSVGALFTVGQQYAARATFNQTQATATDIAVLDQAALAAYAQYPDTKFLAVRARIALLEMNQLVNILADTQDPTEEQQQVFLNVSARALAILNQAVTQDSENPAHQAILAAVYNNLAIAGEPNALDRAATALERAQALDPKNPTYHLISAQMAARRGDVTTARESLESALQMKRNFTEALFLLAEIERAEGNIQAAIETTQAITRLEPDNPARQYQLGLLFVAAENASDAQTAFGRALQIDPEHANARYSRALLLAQAGDVETALDELRLVQIENQDSELLSTVITQLEAGTLPRQNTAGAVDLPVSELTPQTADETVTSTILPESNLLTPLNAQANTPQTAAVPAVLTETETPIDPVVQEQPIQAVPE